MKHKMFYVNSHLKYKNKLYLATDQLNLFWFSIKLFVFVYSKKINNSCRSINYKECKKYNNVKLYLIIKPNFVYDKNRYI